MEKGSETKALVYPASLARTATIAWVRQRWYFRAIRATSLLDMSSTARDANALRTWTIETYHRALKQFTGIERGLFRRDIAHRNHIGLAIRAYLRLELHRWRYRLPNFVAKLDIIRAAVRLYLAQPRFVLPIAA